MPTHQPVVSTLVPKEEAKPIPVRVISTRNSKPKSKSIPVADSTNGNQAANAVSDPAAASATTAESVKLSPQLSALARKEQAFRQREQALKQREKDLEAKLAKSDQFDQLQAKIAAKDYSEAEKAGMNYEDYVQYKLNQQAGEDPNSIAFKKLEDEIQVLKKGQEDSASQQFDETVEAYRKELSASVESKPEFQKVKKFEDEDSKGKKFTGIDVALQLILDSWEEDGEEMTVEQALVDTEIFIRERAQRMASLLDDPKPAAEAKPLPPPKPSVKTLTNQMQPTANTQKPASLQHLSESERYAEARRRVLARRQLQGT